MSHGSGKCGGDPAVFAEALYEAGGRRGTRCFRIVENSK